MAQFQHFVLARGEEPPYLMDVGGRMWGLEIRARKNSSATKRATFPARARTAEKAHCRMGLAGMRDSFA